MRLNIAAIPLQRSRDGLSQEQAQIVRDAARDAALAAREQAQAAREQAQAAREQAKASAQELKEQIRAAIDAAREANGGQLPPIPPIPPTPPDAPWLGPGSTGGRWPGDGDIPQQAVDMVSITGLTLVCCVVGFPLARAIARWIDRRGNAQPASPEVVARLEGIEQAVESIAVEVERISEGQRFTTRMLSERAHEPARDFLGTEREEMHVGGSPGNMAGNPPANARRS